MGCTTKIGLDNIQVMMQFNESETYVDYYIHTQNFINEYELTYPDKIFIPIIKIINQFLVQLNCAPEYVPFLTEYTARIANHIKNYGDVDNRIDLDFTVTDIYNH